ncbi:MAG: DUF485 domain-containing protein [Gammaproteobacteria bacterium]|jgi:uncharacterized membrane protein (DUF485 family)|nr:MAG: DUF485 domain-containing protein [Gammaproteobacteria bacterium]
MNLEQVTRQRWRIAVALSVVVLVLYFGFILFVAFNREAVGRMLAPGLSVGILLGALVIVAAWLTTWVYVHWANRHFDRQVERLRADGAPR